MRRNSSVDRLCYGPDTALQTRESATGCRMNIVFRQQTLRDSGMAMSPGGVSLVGRLMAIVCVAILAHIILMTSATSAEGHHSASPPKVQGHVVDQPHIASTMDASPCYTTRLWVEPTRFTPSTQLQTPPLTIHFHDSLPIQQSWFVPPSRPPDVIRALLQVYRI